MKSFHGTVIEDQQELSPACILKSERQQQTFPSLTAESAVDGTPIPWTGGSGPLPEGGPCCGSLGLDWGAGCVLADQTQE